MSQSDIRRKQPGHANKKNQQQQTTNGHSSHCDTKVEEQKTILPEKTTEKEKEYSKQQENLPRQEIPSPSSLQIDDDPRPFTFPKHRHKSHLSNPPIAPETSTPPITNGKYPSNHHENHFKSNGQILPSYPMCTYAPHNPLPPRFRQQQQQQQPKETVFSNSRFRRRRGGGGGGRFAKRSSYPPDSMRYSNDFVPTSEEQEQIQEEQVENQEIESSKQQDLSATNGYSSESDILTGKIQSIISNLSSRS